MKTLWAAAVSLAMLLVAMESTATEDLSFPPHSNLKPPPKIKIAGAVRPGYLDLGLTGSSYLLAFAWNQLLAGAEVERNSLEQGQKRGGKVLFTGLDNSAGGYEPSRTPNWLSLALFGQLTNPRGNASIKIEMRASKVAFRLTYRW